MTFHRYRRNRSIGYLPLLLTTLVLMTVTQACLADTPAASAWIQTSPLLSPRSGAGIVEVDGVIYAVGGIDGKHFLKSSEYSKIQDNGTLSMWQYGSALNEERGFFGVAAHRDYLYAVGGGNGPSGHHLLRSVERAPILPGGGLGPWRRESPLNFPRRCAKVVAAGDYLYAIGGFGGTLFDSVERARFNPDGSLGPWEILDDKLTMPRYIHAVTEARGRLYILGGHAQQGGMGESATEYTIINKNNELTSWHESAALGQGRYGLAAAAHGNDLYALGGMSGATFFDVIEKNYIDNNGLLGNWSETAPLPAPLADFGAIVYRDTIYIVGGTSPQGYFNAVFFSHINETGDLVAPLVKGKLTATAPIPTNRLELPNKGRVLQALDGGAYIYVQVNTGSGQEWLAAAHTDLVPGDNIRYSEGIWMEDFFSKYLQRSFKAIRFVGSLEKISVKSND